MNMEKYIIDNMEKYFINNTVSKWKDVYTKK